jgi:hypothetical protein
MDTAEIEVFLVLAEELHFGRTAASARADLGHCARGRQDPGPGRDRPSIGWSLTARLPGITGGAG